MTAQDVAEKIASVKGMQPRRMGSEWLVRCPCADHEDRNPSLSVGEGDKRDVVLYCHAGCHVDDVLRAAGLTRADLNGHSGQDRAPQTVYDYVDETGRLLFQVVRKPGKKFVQRRPDGTGWTYKLGDTRRVPYMLPELLAAVAKGMHIYVAEGEKDVLTLTARGLVATCNPGGAGKWRDDYSKFLAGAPVTIIADNDQAGHDHARKVAASLAKHTATVSVVVPTMGKDVTGHLDAGGRFDQLVPLDGGPEGTPVPTLDVVSLDTVRPERVTWLWDRRLPAGKVVILDGDPGLGKSTVAVEMAAHVTTGKPWPDGHPCPTGDVLILSAEDGLADTIRPRLDAAGGDPSRAHAVRAAACVDEETGERGQRPVVIPADLGRIEELAVRLGVRLVIVDVLMAYLDGRVNSHRDQDVRRALARLHDLAERTGATVLVLRHLNKGGGSSALYRGGGSIGIVGAARVGLMVGLDPDDDTGQRRVLATVKNNLAPHPPSLGFRLDEVTDLGAARVSWLGVVDRSADDLVASRPDGAEKSERDEAKKWLREYLESEGGRASAKDIKKHGRSAGFSERTLDRARDEAGIKWSRSGFGKGSNVVWLFTGQPYSPHTPHTRQPSGPGEYGEYVASMDGDPSDDPSPQEPEPTPEQSPPEPPDEWADYLYSDDGEPIQ